MDARGLTTLILATCLGCSSSAEPPTVTPTAVAPAAPAAVAEPVLVAAAPEDLFYGNIVSVLAAPPNLGSEGGADSDEAPRIAMRLLVRETRPVTRPEGDPLGYLWVHEDRYWELRSVSEGASRHATVGVVGLDGPCDARVIRARTLHGSMRVTPAEAPGGILETSFEALEIEGCEGGMGVAGRSVITQLLRAERAAPASSARATLIEDLDRLDTDHGTPEWNGVVSALEFPEHDLAVVFGRNTWLVRGGTVLLPRGGGFPNAIVLAGDAVLFWMSTESDDWLTPLERATPPRADGTASD